MGNGVCSSTEWLVPQEDIWENGSGQRGIWMHPSRPTTFLVARCLSLLERVFLLMTLVNGMKPIQTSETHLFLTKPTQKKRDTNGILILNCTSSGCSRPWILFPTETNGGSKHMQETLGLEVLATGKKLKTTNTTSSSQGHEPPQ